MSVMRRHLVCCLAIGGTLAALWLWFAASEAAAPGGWIRLNFSKLAAGACALFFVAHVAITTAWVGLRANPHPPLVHLCTLLLEVAVIILGFALAR